MLNDFLLKKEVITKEQLEEVLSVSNQQHSDPIDVLIGKQYVEPVKLFSLIAEYFGVEYVDLKNIEIPSDVIKLIPKRIAIERKIIPYKKDPFKLKVAMVNPADIQSIEFIKRMTGYNIDANYIPESDFRELLKYYSLDIKEEFNNLLKKNIQESKASGNKDSVPVIKITDMILNEAINEEASDIHMESLEYESIVRFRIDGILHDIEIIPKDIFNSIVARIKILANLKIDEHRLPQDGRFKLTINDRGVSFRTSIIPTFYGEKIVLRVLEESDKKYSLEDLGFAKRDLDKVLENIKKPHGMILVTGPTGSGKSTTLNTVISILNTPDVNINTVEDPIEYAMARVNQTQVNPSIGLTFASTLRSLLRQDPNVILVGEIRDKETADIAINAAMTGHLLLSTLHTNDSVGAIPRLIDMQIEPFLISSTLNLIIAQRLVRVLCQSCKLKTSLSQKQIDVLKDTFKNNVNSMELIDKNEFFKPVGCDKCRNGYRGRIGIYEIIEVTNEIKELINEKAPVTSYIEVAKRNNFRTMQEDGLEKASLGITSIEEILRVTME